MNESTCENIFIKDVRAQGGVAVKLRHRFMAGLPDLFVKMPDRHLGVFIECKYEPWPKRKTTIALKLTPLQRDFLRRMQGVSQSAGWVLFTTIGDMSSALVGDVLSTSEIDLELFVKDRFTRPYGGQWPVCAMIENMRVLYDY